MAEFSKGWKSSKKPGRQRKYLFNAPHHIRNKFMAAKLSKDLAKKQGIRKAAVRKGDKVKIVRGQFRGKSGRVNRTSIIRTKLFIDGIERTKIDGSKAFYPIHPSNVIITELNLDDKRRLKRAKKNEKQA